MGNEKSYIEAYLTTVRKCRSFQPKFASRYLDGTCSLLEYQAMFRIDPFAHCLGLDSEWMYTAYRLGGVAQEIHHSVRLGCARMLRAIVHDQADYSHKSDSSWHYTVRTRANVKRKEKMDFCLETDKINNAAIKQKVEDWIAYHCRSLDRPSHSIRGAVFEVHHGYDASGFKTVYKNINPAAHAWAHGFLPLVVTMTNNIDVDEAVRLNNMGYGFLSGNLSELSHRSTYAFFKQVLNYDLWAFICDYAPALSQEINLVYEQLLSQHLAHHRITPNTSNHPHFYKPEQPPDRSKGYVVHDSQIEAKEDDEKDVAHPDAVDINQKIDPEESSDDGERLFKII